MEIINADALTARFGGWPSFHDAEVYSVTLDSGQRGDGVARVEMDLHVFEIDGTLPSGDLNFSNHSLVTLAFEDVDELDLDEFGSQNVLQGLLLEDATGANEPRLRVTLPSSNGLAGAFTCKRLTVVDAVPFEPGEHSVYR